MNKSDLVDGLASKTGMTKADAARAIDALFSSDGGIIAGALKARTPHSDYRFRHLRVQAPQGTYGPQPPHGRGDPDQGDPDARVPRR